MNCPECGNQIMLNVYTMDVLGEFIVSCYKCESCKKEFSESEILDISEENKFSENTVLK